MLRAIVALLFVGHGAQRLFGWFGGGGPEGTGQFFESVGVRPGKQNAVASGISETAGGALLALGLATPLASAALSGTMATALWTVQKDKGPWATAGGYEYNLTLLAVLFALADLDPREVVARRGAQSRQERAGMDAGSARCSSCGHGRGAEEGGEPARRLSPDPPCQADARPRAVGPAAGQDGAGRLVTERS